MENFPPKCLHYNPSKNESPPAWYLGRTTLNVIANRLLAVKVNILWLTSKWYKSCFYKYLSCSSNLLSIKKYIFLITYIIQKIQVFLASLCSSKSFKDTPHTKLSLPEKELLKTYFSEGNVLCTWRHENSTSTAYLRVHGPIASFKDGRENGVLLLIFPSNRICKILGYMYLCCQCTKISWNLFSTPKWPVIRVSFENFINSCLYIICF